MDQVRCCRWDRGSGGWAHPRSPLCSGSRASLPCAPRVAALYRRCPPAKAWLCLYRGRYYLAVHAGLRARPRAVRAATPYGELLGPARVLYAYCEEHGQPISHNAVPSWAPP